MSSGNRNIVINPNERAVSTDINRLQAMLGAQWGEYLRALMLSIRYDDGSPETNPSSTSNPLAAMIVDGLVPRPGIGSTALTVTGGTIAIVDPDGTPNADDSPLKLVVDRGSSGFLTLTPNASGDDRIDVLEVSRTDFVQETASRDIFNLSSQLFAPATVNKVKATKLTYRIRTGTPGGGFPGTASGWLPIMIASVFDGASTWDDVPCWDVRPLFSDLADAQALFHTQTTRRADFNFGITANTLFGELQARFQQWKVGGVLPIGGINVTGDDYGTSTGWAAALTQRVWHLYACFPYGLPRWCQLTPPGFGSRVPSGMRGLLVASGINPDQTGAPISSLSLPANMMPSGELALISEAVALMSGSSTGAGVMLKSLGSGDWTYPEESSTVTHTSAAGAPYVFTFADNGGKYPAYAKTLLVEFIIPITPATAPGAYNAAFGVNVEVDGWKSPQHDFSFYDAGSSAAMGTSGFKFRCEIPLRQSYPDSVVPNTRTVKVNGALAPIGAGYAVFGAGAATARVVGWKL